MSDLFFPLAAFAVSTSITPGPNNIMLTASGANFGFRRTLPHMAGIAFGFPLMLLAICLGLGGVFRALPQIHVILRYVGLVYLLWLAWKIATSGPSTGSAETTSKPLSFVQAAGFQWVNPKAWIMAAGAVTTYTSPDRDVLIESLLIAGIFAAVSFPCVALWASVGAALERLLREPLWLRVFNVTMAVLVVASVLPFVFE
ncbi:LysE family translocator [Cystobacter fuscus]|uniref:LysE family translocator n=1 Tax=Cystobacter fuscus TaxID=43 RepID=UPI002B2DE9C7|nr:LysE family translocator [Cystobacter fuscus]